MYCGDLASRPPITVTSDATLHEVAEKMAQHRVGLLVVVDKANPKKPIGVVSERDVIRAIAAKMPLDTTVDKVGTMYNFVFVYVDEPITAAARKMKERGVRHVVVLDKNGELYGVISIRDLIREKAVLEILARDRVPTKE